MAAHAGSAHIRVMMPLAKTEVRLHRLVIKHHGISSLVHHFQNVVDCKILPTFHRIAHYIIQVPKRLLRMTPLTSSEMLMVPGLNHRVAGFSAKHPLLRELMKFWRQCIFVPQALRKYDAGADSEILGLFIRLLESR